MKNITKVTLALLATILILELDLFIFKLPLRLFNNPVGVGYTQGHMYRFYEIGIILLLIFISLFVSIAAMVNDKTKWSKITFGLWILTGIYYIIHT